MSTVKTAISIEKSQLEEIDEMSQRLKMSRSQFFCLAARRLAQEEETSRLLFEINAAHDDVTADKEERKWLQGMKKVHRKALKNEKW